MNDKVKCLNDIDEALKIAAFLDEPDEYHIPMRELEGLTLEVILNSYEHTTVNSFNNDILVEILVEEGTILCDFKNKLCINAALFPHEEETKKEKYCNDQIKTRFLSDNIRQTTSASIGKL